MERPSGPELILHDLTRWDFHVYVSIQTPFGGVVLDNSPLRWIYNRNADEAVERYQEPLDIGVCYRFCEKLAFKPELLTQMADALRTTVEILKYPKGSVNCFQDKCKHNE